jgi:predicted transcriptional regulator
MDFITISEFTKKMWFSRQAVTKYINTLEENNIISSFKIGRNKLVFIPIFRLLN